MRRQGPAMLGNNLMKISFLLVILIVVGNAGPDTTAVGNASPLSKALQAHNKYRSQHHSPALNWSDGLAEKAGAIAQRLATQSVLVGKQDGSALNLGQNLAKLAGSLACNDAAEIATNLWYSQAKNYSYSDPRLNADTDTFTQVVWKDTKEVGIGCAKNPLGQAGPMYVVALYKPAGNIPKLLRGNVLEPGPRGNDPDVYSTLFRRHFEEAKSLGRIQRKPLH
ncbi:Golgi-associated plant pathogenesis-related protein 1-like isoform X2 [Montipora capricornis]|uniref:Golgi-associated plant pathogenesis-related protein 1-like isoform X2 n=1 Tax=Montipora capricornis TaxID=246305 RepID=UPI0035F1CD98